MNRLIDIGVNLTHDSFDADRDEIISRAADAGVDRLIVTGANVSGSVQAIALADQRPGHIFATAGIHPHHASEYSSAVGDRLLSLSRLPAVVAVGECGLDFFRNFSPREDQLVAFRAQLDIAVKAQKPVFLHQRDAHSEFVDVLEEYRSDLTGGVAHCFTGGQAELRRCLELELHIGITGWICDERRGAELREAVGSIPMDRLLLETDAPYLLPRDIKNKPAARRNEPALLPHILLRLANEMGKDPELIAAASTENAERLFNLPKADPTSGSGGSSG